MVEEMLVDSGIPFTIIQPAVLMQNLLESKNSIENESIFRQKFFTSDKTRMCMVDLEDIAEVAAAVITQPGHTGASYELWTRKLIPVRYDKSDGNPSLPQNQGRNTSGRTICSTDAEAWRRKLPGKRVIHDVPAL